MASKFPKKFYILFLNPIWASKPFYVLSIELDFSITFYFIFFLEIHLLEGPDLRHSAFYYDRKIEAQHAMGLKVSHLRSWCKCFATVIQQWPCQAFFHLLLTTLFFQLDCSQTCWLASRLELGSQVGSTTAHLSSCYLKISSELTAIISLPYIRKQIASLQVQSKDWYYWRLHRLNYWGSCLQIL